MKPLVLSVALAALVSPPLLLAATVTVNVSGQPATYTLDSLSISNTGEVTVNASPIGGDGGGAPTSYTLAIGVSPSAGGSVSVGGSPVSGVVSYPAGTVANLTASPAQGYTFAGWLGACSGTAGCAVTMSTNQNVTATFTASSGGGDPGAGGCVESGNLLCKTTGVYQQTYPKTLHTPSPSQVLAFQFATPPSGLFEGAGIAVRTISANTSKLVVISTTPGDLDITTKPKGCYASGTESTTVNYTNDPSRSTRYFCPLEVGKTYYFNVASQTMTSSALTCSNTTNCGFTFTAR